LFEGDIYAMMVLPDRDFCENQVEQPPPAVFCRRGRLLYNLLIY